MEAIFIFTNSLHEMVRVISWGRFYLEIVGDDMESRIFEIMGTMGSLIMCASSIPQIIKTYRTKCAAGLSGTYLTILIIGMSLILSYALHVQDKVFVIGNGISLSLTGILVVLWFRYRKT